MGFRVKPEYKLLRPTTLENFLDEPIGIGYVIPKTRPLHGSHDPFINCKIRSYLYGFSEEKISSFF